jgi:hypothetical protein
LCQIAVDQPVAEPRRLEPIDLEPIADRNLGTVATVGRPKQPGRARKLRQNSDDVGTLNTAGRYGGRGIARRDECQRAPSASSPPSRPLSLPARRGPALAPHFIGRTQEFRQILAIERLQLREGIDDEGSVQFDCRHGHVFGGIGNACQRLRPQFPVRLVIRGEAKATAVQQRRIWGPRPESTPWLSPGSCRKLFTEFGAVDRPIEGAWKVSGRRAPS